MKTYYSVCLLILLLDQCIIGQSIVKDVLFCDENCNPVDEHDCKSSYGRAIHTLYCNDGIKILDVMWGRQDLQTCLLNKKHCGYCDTTCNSTQAYNVIYNLCNNKSTCKVDFLQIMLEHKDDPCWFTFKYGRIRYGCISDDTNVNTTSVNTTIINYKNDYNRQTRVYFWAMIGVAVFAICIIVVFTMTLITICISWRNRAHPPTLAANNT